MPLKGAEHGHSAPEADEIAKQVTVLAHCHQGRVSNLLAIERIYSRSVILSLESVVQWWT